MSGYLRKIKVTKGESGHSDVPCPKHADISISMHKLDREVWRHFI